MRYINLLTYSLQLLKDTINFIERRITIGLDYFLSIKCFA